jgi:hypothetical protein
MNARELQDALNAVFFSWTGPPRAYIEIEHTNEAGEPAFFRIVYKVFALGVNAAHDDATDYESKLCDELHRRFMALQTQEEQEDHVATLIWRRDVRYDANPVTRWDDEAEDWVATGRVIHRVSMRCYCPRAERAFTPTPEGMECELMEVAAHE